MSAPTTRPDDGRPPSPGPADIDTLVHAHRSWLVRHVATQVRRGDGDLVEDLVQTALVRAWRALPAARLESIETERAWLSAIARHTVADHYRANATRQRAREQATDPTDVTAWHVDGRDAVGDDTERVCTLVDLVRSMQGATAEDRGLVALRLLDTPWVVLAGATRQGKARVRRLTAEATAGVIG